jgi:hypothetical protein
MWDFVMDKSGAGALRFSLPIYIPSATPQSSSLSPEAGTIDQEWPRCQQPHKPELKKKTGSSKDGNFSTSWEETLYRGSLYLVCRFFLHFLYATTEQFLIDVPEHLNNVNINIIIRGKTIPYAELHTAVQAYTKPSCVCSQNKVW